MIDKKARQKRLEKANQFLAYFATVGYYYFYHPDWQWGQSKITLVPIGNGYRQGCWLYDGSTNKHLRILQNSRKLEREIGEAAKRIVVQLSHWIMSGSISQHPAWWRDIALSEKAVELGIK